MYRKLRKEMNKWLAIIGTQIFHLVLHSLHFDCLFLENISEEPFFQNKLAKKLRSKDAYSRLIFGVWSQNLGGRTLFKCMDCQILFVCVFPRSVPQMSVSQRLPALNHPATRESAAKIKKPILEDQLMKNWVQRKFAVDALLQVGHPNHESQALFINYLSVSNTF